MNDKKFCIIVHGGAGLYPENCTPQLLQEFNRSITEIVEKGFEILKNVKLIFMQGGSAIDAIETTVRSLEDDPLYNAGTGCCLTSIGTVELDALIMDGTSSNFDCAKNPISLARLVLEKSPHCMIVGNGARIFAENEGFPTLKSTNELVTQRAKDDLSKISDYRAEVKKNASHSMSYNCFDTVGAVALDLHGNIACGTSSGGINAKHPGRIGDVPLVGCGGFANKFAGASCTGHGESLMKSLFCKTVVDLIENKKLPKEACCSVLKDIFKRFNGVGGVISLNKSAQLGICHNTEFMPWAYVHSHDGFKSFLSSPQ